LLRRVPHRLDPRQRRRRLLHLRSSRRRPEADRYLPDPRVLRRRGPPNRERSARARGVPKRVQGPRDAQAAYEMQPSISTQTASTPGWPPKFTCPECRVRMKLP